MDFFVARMYGPTAYLWGRELSTKPFFSTAIRTDTYGYIASTSGPLSPLLEPMTWSEFENLWISNSPDWVSNSGPCIVATTPENRRGTMSVWRQKKAPYEIVVVSDTGRVTTDTDVPIFEILWCGYLQTGILTPSKGEHCFREMCTAVAGSLGPGILFGTSSATGGGVNASWPGWRFGTSGVHSWFMYNYVPPAFGNCTIHAIRDEL